MILEIVSGSNEHLTAEQIFLRMKEITGKISLATVYNNLVSFLHQQGLIRKLTLGRRKVSRGKDMTVPSDTII